MNCSHLDCDPDREWNEYPVSKENVKRMSDKGVELDNDGQNLNLTGDVRGYEPVDGMEGGRDFNLTPNDIERLEMPVNSLASSLIISGSEPVKSTPGPLAEAVVGTNSAVDLSHPKNKNYEKLTSNPLFITLFLNQLSSYSNHEATYEFNMDSAYYHASIIFNYLQNKQ